MSITKARVGANVTKPSCDLAVSRTRVAPCSRAAVLGFSTRVLATHIHAFPVTRADAVRLGTVFVRHAVEGIDSFRRPRPAFAVNRHRT